MDHASEVGRKRDYGECDEQGVMQGLIPSADNTMTQQAVRRKEPI